MKVNDTSYQRLSKRWIKKHKKLQRQIHQKHKEAISWIKYNPQQIALGSLGGLLLLNAPAVISLPQPSQQISDANIQPVNKTQNLISDLEKVVPSDVRFLSSNEEKVISDLLSIYSGFNVTSEIDGKSLPRSYGLIGAEQHLMRYPGDSIYSHFDSQNDRDEFSSSGMAPGRGAWGYFAQSKNELTHIDILREKYYIATQTFLVSDYNLRVSEYRDFFKYRKMLVVNPQNGKMIVVVIGDAGPAEWTGKHLGGSPEVMKYLEREDGSRRGPVLYFFINDPEDKIPLGPLNI